ncbi:MAG: homoserine dehydrogenase [Phycisphaerae bacterium]|nr:homoserine dehydrogenase [Phycisphaerae bacterium]
MSESVPLGVAIVGCGTVGGAAARLLTRDREILTGRSGRALELRYLVDVNFDHARQLGLDESLFCDDLAAALNDKNVHVVAELVGGLTVARDVIEKALRAGKHVVTANKALLAHAGAELYALARRQGVSIAFEASCAGGIPIIRALTDGLIANRLDALYGIVNGTCNFILTEMTAAGRGYAEVLAEAQKAGLAEADPTLDVSGEDSAHKLAILASLAFGRRIDYDAIPVSGIDTLELCDVEFGLQLGYVVKLLAIASRQEDGVSLRVRPAFISKEHPLAWVSGPFNAVSVYGHATGHTMYYGRGAGGKPTASAVVADIVSLALGTWQQRFAQLAVWPDQAQPAQQLPIEDVQSRYYLRVTCRDAPGVFGRIAAILGRHDISITSVLQQEPRHPAAEGVPVIITTHQAREGNVRNAVAEIDALDVVTTQSVCIGIVEEYPEDL